MQPILTQRRFHIKREFTIYESKIQYKTSNFITENEITVAYEDLTGKKESVIISNVLFLAGFGVFAFFTTLSFFARNDKDFDHYAWIYCAFLSIVGLIAFFITRENLWRIRLNSYLPLLIFKSVPNKETVDEFIDKIFEARNKYLRENYMYVDKNLDYQKQFNNFSWLKNIEAITKEECDSKQEELRTVFNVQKSNIGFNIN